MLAYFSRPNETWFIDAQLIEKGKGDGIFSDFEKAYVEGGFLEQVFFIPIGP
jgi:hypothetical protein